MTPHKQLFRHNPPETYGDCGRTVYACLLDLRPEEIPHFFQGKDIEIEIGAQKGWLDAQGLVEYQILYPGAEPLEIADVVLAYRPKPKTKPARRRKRRAAKLGKQAP